MAMPSRDWEYFIDNFFGDPYMMWHDGIDTKSVLRLEGQEREDAEQMLIEELQQGNYWAAMGLRELKSTKAIPLLKNHLNSSNGKLIIEAAVALNVIEHTTDYTSHIIDVLKRSVAWMHRLDAARVLREFPTPEVLEALYSALLDPEYLVRNHASESILLIYGLEPTIATHSDIFDHIRFDFDSTDDESVKASMEHYKEAAELIRTLVLAKGTKPDMIGD
jgi:hypothetical protein